MPAERPCWTHQEAGLSDAARELGRLRRRALGRFGRTLLLSLVIVGAFLGMRARKQRSYTASVVLRVTEGDIDEGTAPRPARKLREYVRDVAFAGPRLLRLIRDNGLYRRELARDPGLAIEEMRDDIEIEVWRNYFLAIREYHAEARSARISVSFTSADPDRALLVAQALGDLVMEEAAASRAALTEAAARGVEANVIEAQEQLARAQGRLRAVQLALPGTDPLRAAAMRGEILHLKKTVDRLTERLKEQDSHRAAMTMRAGLERSRLGLRFEVVDPGRRPRMGLSRPRELIMLGVVAFLLLLPLCGIAVAAYDGRIQDLEDIRRLGLQAVGHVPAFPGAERGSLADRLTRADVPAKPAGADGVD